MESKIWLILTHSFSRHIISFYKIQLLVMSVTLTSGEALVKCTKGENTAFNPPPPRTSYDSITSPGNSHSTICVFMCVFLSGSALSKLEHCSQNKIQPDGDFICNDTLCVYHRDPGFCVVSHQAQERSCSSVTAVFFS